MESFENNKEEEDISGSVFRILPVFNTETLKKIKIELKLKKENKSFM